MATRKPRTVFYRRKREHKTRYSKRLKLLMSGQKRLVVRLTNRKVIAQLVEFTPSGDRILVGVDSFALKKYEWNYSCKSIPAAYLTGLLFGKKVKEIKFKEQAVLDTGFDSPLHKGRVYAFLKGALDAGLTVPHGDKTIFPDEAKIQGKHIQDFAAAMKGQVGSQFTQYLKSNAAPDKMTATFAQVKQKIGA